MHPPDESKTAFTTGRGIYSYKVMPFELKNVGATFQRTVDRVFKDLIGRPMEVYVKDMLIKSTMRKENLQYPGEVFDFLQNIKVTLNPKKCTFGVASGKFLGYLVTQRGIEADPNQISAILNIRSPTCVKDAQMLNGRLAALN